MDYQEYVHPKLVENGMKYFLNETLKNCHEFKEKYRNWLLNIGMFSGFFLFLICFLFLIYKGKPTPMERQQKDREKQQYILSKIKIYKENREKTHQSLITGLPNWENDYTNF